MPHQHIAIVNKSSVVRDEEVQRVASALRVQAQHHLSVEWGLRPPDLRVSSEPPSGPWQPLLIVDTDADVPGALGYHDETESGPYGRVLAKTCADYGVSWSSCASHEIVEMMGDQFVDYWTNQGNTLWATELCDPVESNTYTIDGIEVSDFVLPSWFDGYGKAPFSYMDKKRMSGAPGLTQPFQVAKNGYAILAKQWPNVTQVFANGSDLPHDDYPAWKVWELKIEQGSRSLRRHEKS